MSSQIRRGLRRESRELAFERLDCASAPALGDGPGCGVGKNFVFTFLQAIEDAQRRGFGRGLRYLEAAVHICVDRAKDNGMDRYALAGQERPQRLRQLNAAALEI